MQRLYDWVWGDLRYRLNKKVRTFEKKIRAQERDLDRSILDTMRTGQEADRNFKHAQHEKRHEDVLVYANALAQTRISERYLRNVKSRLHSQLEQLRHRAQLAVQANNIVEMNKLMNEMVIEMTDIKVVSLAANQIEQSEFKYQVLQDVVDDASATTAMAPSSEEMESEVARIMADSVPNPPVVRVEEKVGSSCSIDDLSLEERLQKL